MIAFISPDHSATAKVHHEFNLAGWAKSTRTLPYINPRHFINEWLYEVQIPETQVIHIVTLAIVLARGFSLAPLKLHLDGSFPNLDNFLRSVRIESQNPFEKGFVCGLAAFDFGIRAPTRAIAIALSGLPLDQSRLSPRQERASGGIDDAITERWLDVYDSVRYGLEEEEIELKLEYDALHDDLGDILFDIHNRWESYHAVHSCIERLTRRISEIEDLLEARNIAAGY